MANAVTRNWFSVFPIIGFLTGIYIPIGILPSYIQVLIKLFPAAHAAALFRQVFMEAPLGEVFAEAPMATVLEFKQMFGVVYELKGQMISASTSILLLLATAAVFFGLGVRRVFKQNFS